MDVLAVQRGTSDPGRVIVISAHMDSRNSDALDARGDAPGANDDASGVSAVLEAARVLSARKFPATIVYAVLSGEEQGLFGGKVLADHAVAQGWQVEADLNNDIIGNTRGLSGVMDNSHVRIFSEGSRTNETPAAGAGPSRCRRGERQPSRNIARFMQGLADATMNGFSVKMVYRPDRFARGGDHREMLNQGFPAVRITEAAENYTRQHQNVRVENGIHYGDVLEGVDFDYLAQVTRLNVITLAALALAPAPPTGVTIAGAVTPDTVVSWKKARMPPSIAYGGATPPSRNGDSTGKPPGTAPCLRGSISTTGSLASARWAPTAMRARWFIRGLPAALTACRPRRARALHSGAGPKQAR